ncbi:hypothetical protein [Halopelagius fulvigenes]|uniref:Uncharacterized protein n=1 Tax=Halopelagius fulvigenes TaxID=1198324 RepID=A0ABD5U832_9EURY
MTDTQSGAGVGRATAVAQLCFGLALVGYGAAQWTNLVTATLPAVVSLAGGAVLLILGVTLLYRRS